MAGPKDFLFEPSKVLGNENLYRYTFNPFQKLFGGISARNELGSGEV